MMSFAQSTRAAGHRGAPLFSEPICPERWLGLKSGPIIDEWISFYAEGPGRSYLAKAIEYGLDAAIVDVKHRFGQVEPDTGLLKLVDACSDADATEFIFKLILSDAMAS